MSSLEDLMRRVKEEQSATKAGQQNSGSPYVNYEKKFLQDELSRVEAENHQLVDRLGVRG